MQILNSPIDWSPRDRVRIISTNKIGDVNCGTKNITSYEPKKELQKY